MTEHPITPPPELAECWLAESFSDGIDECLFATRAAQWGADQELKACCEWLVSEGWFKYEHEAVQELRDARRPKPPSLKEQAKQALGRFSANAHINADEMVADFELLRRAMEQLDD